MVKIKAGDHFARDSPRNAFGNLFLYPKVRECSESSSDGLHANMRSVKGQKIDSYIAKEIQVHYGQKMVKTRTKRDTANFSEADELKQYIYFVGNTLNKAINDTQIYYEQEIVKTRTKRDTANLSGAEELKRYIYAANNALNKAINKLSREGEIAFGLFHIMVFIISFATVMSKCGAVNIIVEAIKTLGALAGATIEICGLHAVNDGVYNLIGVITYALLMQWAHTQKLFTIVTCAQVMMVIFSNHLLFVSMCLCFCVHIGGHLGVNAYWREFPFCFNFTKFGVIAFCGFLDFVIISMCHFCITKFGTIVFCEFLYFVIIFVRYFCFNPNKKI